MLSKLAAILVSPLGTSFAIGLIAIVLMLVRRRSTAGLLGSVALFWLALWSLPASHQWLFQKMTSDYPPSPMTDLPEARAIVVLGGGVYAPNVIRPWPDLSGAADRLWHAAALYHMGKAPLVLLSGGLTSHTGTVSEAAAMALVLGDLGVPQSAMLLEEESLNTRQNAEHAKKLLSVLDAEQILLVSSVVHMPRAIYEFKRQGFDVIPAPSDYAIEPLVGWQNYAPSAAALDGNARLFKELLGVVIISFKNEVF